MTQKKIKFCNRHHLMVITKPKGNLCAINEKESQTKHRFICFNKRLIDFEILKRRITYAIIIFLFDEYRFSHSIAQSRVRTRFSFSTAVLPLY